MDTDGAGTGTGATARPDRNDWVTSCVDQLALRTMLDDLVAALAG